MAHSFSRVSVGISFVKIDQAGEAGKRSKEIRFEKSSFWTLPSLNPLNRFPSVLCQTFNFNEKVCTLNRNVEIRPSQQPLNPDVNKLNPKQFTLKLVI